MEPAERGKDDPKRKQADEWADMMVQEAEAARARVHDVPCMSGDLFHQGQIEAGLREIRRATDNANNFRVNNGSVDDNYLLVASHVEEALRLRIINHEFVDFARLIRRDSWQGTEEQNRMIMINKGGYSY